MFYSIKTKIHAVNLSEIIKVSSYYFAKSKIAQKRAKIYFFLNRQKKNYARYKICDAIFSFRRPKTSCMP